MATDVRQPVKAFYQTVFATSYIHRALCMWSAHKTQGSGREDWRAPSPTLRNEFPKFRTPQVTTNCRL